MAEAVSLHTGHPHLESVFGPLTEEEDAHLRVDLAQVDALLRQLARHFGQNGAGWEGTGLELVWMRSGQTRISSYVETMDEAQHAAAFLLELRPSWYDGQRSGVPGWDIEMTLEVDCQPGVDHESMEAVYERPVAHAHTPTEAVELLLAAARDLLALGRAHPVSHWTAMGRG